MMHSNVQELGDSRQKNIIMKTTNNMSENQRNIYLSCRWTLYALQDFDRATLRLFHWNKTYTEIFVKLRLLIACVIEN